LRRGRGGQMSFLTWVRRLRLRIFLPVNLSRKARSTRRAVPKSCGSTSCAMRRPWARTARWQLREPCHAWPSGQPVWSADDAGLAETRPSPGLPVHGPDAAPPDGRDRSCGRYAPPAAGLPPCPRCPEPASGWMSGTLRLKPGTGGQHCAIAPEGFRDKVGHPGHGERVSSGRQGVEMGAPFGRRAGAWFRRAGPDTSATACVKLS
jgi:hypothetical protein